MRSVLRHLCGAALCAGVLCLAVASAKADEVTLKNGDRLTGTVVASDSNTLLIKTELEGYVYVLWSAVTSIASTQALHLTLKDGQIAVGTVSTQDGKFEVATRETGNVEVPKDAVVAIRNDAEQAAYDRQIERLRHPRLTDFWSALLDAGLSLTRGNSSTLAYNLSTKAVRTTTADKISVYATEVYAVDDTTVPGRTIASAVRGGVRGDVNIGPRWFMFASTDFEHDAFQGLDLRDVLGGGIGRHLIKTKNATLDLNVGGDFDQEYFTATALLPGLTRKTAEVTAGEQFNIKLNDRVSLSETFNFFPNTSNTGEFRYQLDATAATKVKNWLSWQITYSSRYLSNPLPGFRNNDVLLSTGLRLTAGKGLF